MDNLFPGFSATQVANAHKRALQVFDKLTAIQGGTKILPNCGQLPRRGGLTANCLISGTHRGNAGLTRLVTELHLVRSPEFWGPFARISENLRLKGVWDARPDKLKKSRQSREAADASH